MRRWPLLAVLGVCALTSRTAPADSLSEVCKEWTIAILLEAEGGLEDSLQNDLIELTNMDRPKTHCANIIVQFVRKGKVGVERRYRNWDIPAVPKLAIGREPTDATLDKYWPPALRKNGDPTPQRLWVPGALSDFVTDVVRDFEAAHVAIVIGSHGDGTRTGTGVPTVAQDGTRQLGSSRSPLSDRKFGDELKIILAKLPATSSLEMIGFDACQMASLEGEYEIASLRAPHAIHIVASQDNQGGPGWFYEEWTKTFAPSPSPGSSLATAIMSHREHAWTRWSAEVQPAGTLSHVDSALLSPGVAALDQLGLLLKARAADVGGGRIIEAVNAARCACRRFPSSDHRQARLVDVRCFAEQLATASNGLTSDLKAAATSTGAFFGAAVKDVRCHKDATRCGLGLSVFLPGPNADLSGYSVNDIDPPRFVLRDDKKRSGWAQWVDSWAAAAASTKLVTECTDE